MRRALELLMYAAYSAAALPFAILSLRDLLYFRAHPEMLEVRDSAVEVMEVAAAVPLMGAGLLVAAGLTVYLLRVGPRAARLDGVILILAWVAVFLAPNTEFRSWARVYSEGLTYPALVALPWICAAVRFARAGRPGRW